MPTMKVRAWTKGGDRWTNCLRRYIHDGGFDFTLPSVVAFEDAMATEWYYILRPVMSVYGRWMGFDWEYRDDDDNVLGASHSTLYPGNGFSSGGPIPPQAAYLYHLRTEEAAPTRSRGLQYIPWVSDAWVTGTGQVGPTFMPGLQASATRLGTPFADVLGRTWQAVVWRRATKEWFTIRDVIASRQIASCRKRGSAAPLLDPPSWA